MYVELEIPSFMHNTYNINNLSLQHFNQNYDPFLIPLMLRALILYVSGGTYSLKSTPKDMSNDIFLRSFSWQVHLPSEFLPEICWEEVT